MIELLGPYPKRLSLEGRYSSDFFNRKGELRNIKKLKFWKLIDVLIEKYHFKVPEAKKLCDLMLPMLDFDPMKRATADECLKKEWANEGKVE
jgi:serine/threonine-protein kinase SRPK3